MVFIRHADGPAVHVEKSRPETLAPDQVIARRNALWLHLSTSGYRDPIDFGLRPCSVDAIARLWDVSSRTVRRGLEAARALRSEIQGVDHD